MQVGDNVHVLLGSTLPFVTRQVNIEDMTEAEGFAKIFSLVGECYVHGIMNGEIISGGALKQETLAFC